VGSKNGRKFTKIIAKQTDQKYRFLLHCEINKHDMDIKTDR